MCTVKAYGEIEFLFSIIKIVAICAMILAGGYILFFDSSLVAGATIKNLWLTPTVGQYS
jgi:L-asparagine transporter-like permease